MSTTSILHAQPAWPSLEDFVRDRLGCTCPAEIFHVVQDTGPRLSPRMGHYRRIVIGGRLLIYCIQLQDATPALREMDNWISACRAERDHAGMNRLRLVLTLEALNAMVRGQIEQVFRHAPDIDERVHLHLFDARQLDIETL